jgi:hypothetical protein
MSDVCQEIHTWLNALPTFTYPFSDATIPEKGIYVFFEDGEEAHGAKRIVRIGTHTGRGKLLRRLNEHFVNEKKDRSIFRKNIGCCFLKRDGDAFLDLWKLDLTTRAAKDEHKSTLGSAKQRAVEQRVSEYLRSHFRFVVFEVSGAMDRKELESKLISAVSRCEECGPSHDWLGRYSPKEKIRESGLWLEQELYKTPLNAEELRRLQEPAGNIV